MDEWGALLPKVKKRRSAELGGNDGPKLGVSTGSRYIPGPPFITLLKAPVLSFWLFLWPVCSLNLAKRSGVKYEIKIKIHLIK